MRVTHVLTYVSEDGAFGGPTAVAVAQLAGLHRLGFATSLLAGWDGKAQIATDGRQLLAKATRIGKGFRLIFAPKILSAIWRADAKGAVFHIHLGRDPISMPAALVALFRGRPYVVQTHGMILPKSSILFRMFDAIATKPVLRNAKCVYVLTRDEQEAIRAVAGQNIATELIANGIEDVRIREPRHREERSVVFLARLQSRKRVLTFIEMCKILRDGGTEFCAEVYGPDEGDLVEMLAKIKAAGLERTVRYRGSVMPGHSLNVLRGSGVYVLPSFGEVFPMTILEAMVARTPVVTTEASGLAATLKSLDAAEVTDGSAHELSVAVSTLLNDPVRRESIVRNAEAALHTHFSISAVANQLAKGYRRVL